jgi:bifunctional polynucleotide phosphatase/kinase
VEKLGVEVTIYAACANDGFRKPRTEMWEFMLRELADKAEASDDGAVHVDQAYLVGDAAGREGDHSDSDVHFCENLGIDFFTPEEFFWGDERGKRGDKFHPNWFLPSSLGGDLDAETGEKTYDSSVVMRERLMNLKDLTVLEKPEKTELLLLVGLPGAGKTTYYKNFLWPLGYERVNEHEIGSIDECLRITDHLLVDGKSVVIGMPSSFHLLIQLLM